MNQQDLLREKRELNSFDEVRERVETLHGLNFDDATVDMEKISVISNEDKKKPDIMLDVPNIGQLTLTDWSRKQLGSMLGVKFDKWFDPSVIKADEMEEEIKRRFSRTRQACKVRARRFDDDDPMNGQADGVLRALLSPSYAPIDDVRIFERMESKFRGDVEKYKFVKNHLGEDYYNDRASHYTMACNEIDMGEINMNHPDPKVSYIYKLAAAEGQLPDRDIVYQGLHLRNSEVGYTAVVIDSMMYRLVCLNGAIVNLDGGRLMYRMHRSITDDQIDDLLDKTFSNVGETWGSQGKRLVQLHDTPLAEPREELVKFLERKKATKVFQEKALEAFNEEPLQNQYGVLQAISKAAQGVRDMERRLELEELAGQYLAQAA